MGLAMKSLTRIASPSSDFPNLLKVWYYSKDNMEKEYISMLLKNKKSWFECIVKLKYNKND